MGITQVSHSPGVIFPLQVPEEFRLPNSGYRELIFTSAAFTRDSQGVIAALFRKIYIWDIGTSNLRVVIKVSHLAWAAECL